MQGRKTAQGSKIRSENRSHHHQLRCFGSSWVISSPFALGSSLQGITDPPTPLEHASCSWRIGISLTEILVFSLPTLEAPNAHGGCLLHIPMGTCSRRVAEMGRRSENGPV